MSAFGANGALDLFDKSGALKNLGGQWTRGRVICTKQRQAFSYVRSGYGANQRDVIVHERGMKRKGSDIDKVSTGVP
jgi:hypothetical protein